MLANLISKIKKLFVKEKVPCPKCKGTGTVWEEAMRMGKCFIMEGYKCPDCRGSKHV